jgi:hypothetical protein
MEGGEGIVPQMFNISSQMEMSFKPRLLPAAVQFKWEIIIF